MFELDGSRSQALDEKILCVLRSSNINLTSFVQEGDLLGWLRGELSEYMDLWEFSNRYRKEGPRGE